VVCDERALDALWPAFGAGLARWGAIASLHDPSSELSRLNTARAERVRVSRELAWLLQHADEAYRASGGLVDAVRAAEAHALPEAHPARRIGRLRNATWASVELRDRVVHRPLGVLIDLGGVGKAAIADALALELAEIFATPVLVNLGGDLRAVGSAPWSILVTHDGSLRPDAPGRAVHIDEGGIATSDRTSRRYPSGIDHIIGASALPGHPRRATVVAATAAQANAESLAIVAAGGRWHETWEKSRLPALVITNDGTRHALGGWPSDEGVGW